MERWHLAGDFAQVDVVQDAVERGHDVVHGVQRAVGALEGHDDLLPAASRAHGSNVSQDFCAAVRGRAREFAA